MTNESMPQNPLSVYFTLLVTLHEYYLEAVNIGFDPDQALQLTMKLQELSTLAGLLGNLTGNDD